MEKTLTLKVLQQLAHSLRATSISHVALKGRTWSVHLTASPRIAPPPAAEKPSCLTPSLTPLCAPAPGRVLLRHPLLDGNFAAPGVAVNQHDLLAMVKVGALYLPVRSPVSGRLISFVVNDGDVVGFGQEIAKIQNHAPLASGL
ncbi:acetyl-CoA carboxylase biotin carboxyl carrier protein [Dickeya fangzhongdai]|uniref:acetyl-CoA carboxylase biotin carboxyl carrier protein n=1 Tax=Dickeya fangzhongdai TaxID=1778540 RepID=UPI0004F86A70|nr:biotin/lipoyl-containing protein [Dickeya fangzhongdai]AIR68553.1 acetyl-CoA carboxylase [Dickeya fangzhongdai]KGT98726.1 acetyl-CoA carboxylase [Dickeya fangzhongdai]KHN62502.1 acetyl-CoA carboxylase [Dickeya fangzhongdai]